MVYGSMNIFVDILEIKFKSNILLLVARKVTKQKNRSTDL